jgi:hypothetical protein
MKNKTQIIRLIDVFFIAPFMIYFGLKAENIPELNKDLMVGLGVLTALYNGNNYLKNREVKNV